MRVGTVQSSSTFAKLIESAWYEHPKLRDIGMAVLARDNYSCISCGFRSRPSKQVPHGWMIPALLSHPGLLPTDQNQSQCFCPFCLSAAAVNWSVEAKIVGGRETIAPGILISLAELSQKQVNHLAFTVVSTMSSMKIGGKRSVTEAVAISVNDAMKSRQTTLESDLPIYRTGQDGLFARALAMLPDDLYSGRDQVMEMVRWWPNVEFWEEQGAYWRAASYPKN
jgi:hypothetical protein